MESDSSYNADEIGQYQSLSTSAVMALVLGLLSPVAFSSAFLLIVPLTAVAVAFFALARIKSSAGGLLGTRLVYCALVLAIVFGVSAIARVQVRIELLRRQATETAELWMTMLSEGNAEGALGLMTPSAIAKLNAPDQDNATVPIFTEALVNAQLSQDPLAQALIEMHKRGEKKMVQRESTILHQLSEPRAVFSYVAANDHAADVSYTLSLLKAKNAHRPATWLIDAWLTKEADPPAGNLSQ